MDFELFCAIDRVVVTYGRNLLLRRIRLGVFTLWKEERNRTKKSCVIAELSA